MLNYYLSLVIILIGLTLVLVLLFAKLIPTQISLYKRSDSADFPKGGVDVKINNGNMHIDSDSFTTSELFEVVKSDPELYQYFISAGKPGLGNLHISLYHPETVQKYNTIYQIRGIDHPDEGESILMD